MANSNACFLRHLDHICVKVSMWHPKHDETIRAQADPGEP
jgi:hypothetical protein